MPLKVSMKSERRSLEPVIIDWRKQRQNSGISILQSVVLWIYYANDKKGNRNLLAAVVDSLTMDEDVVSSVQSLRLMPKPNFYGYSTLGVDALWRSDFIEHTE